MMVFGDVRGTVSAMLFRNYFEANWVYSYQAEDFYLVIARVNVTFAALD